MLKKLNKYPEFKIQDGILLYKGLIYILKRLIAEIIQESHDELIHGYQRINKMTEKIERTYYFPGMN